MTLLHRVEFDPSNQSAFGDLIAVPYTPIIQGDFVYGHNTQNWKYNYVVTVTSPVSPPAVGDIYSANNGYYQVIYSNGTTLVVSGTNDPSATGATAGNLTRVTGSGTTPIAFSAWASAAGITFGTGSAISTASGLQTITTGATTSGNYAYIPSRRIIRYRAGQGNTIRFTPVFTSGVTNCLQLYGVGTIINNAPYDGYYFGYESAGATPRFGIHHYRAGSVVSFTPQSSWAAGSSYDPTKGSPLMIRYPYLGYGDVLFYVENGVTGKFDTVHVIQYANSSTAVQLSNPSMQLLGYVKNTGTASGTATITNGSFAALLNGERSFVSNPKWSVDAGTSQTITNSESAVVTIRNCSTYNGVINRGMIRLNQISLGLKEATVVTIRIKVNATLGGTPVWNAVNGTVSDGVGAAITAGNSIATYDVAGTTVTGGQYRFNLNIGGSGTETVDLTPHEIYIPPGEQCTFSGIATGNSTVGMSINWSEDI